MAITKDNTYATPTPVIDEEYISVCKIDGEYLGITRCQWCKRPIQYWMPETDAFEADGLTETNTNMK